MKREPCGGIWACLDFKRALAICALLLSGLLLGALFSPQPIIAQETPNETPADNGYEEIVYIDNAGYVRVYDHPSAPNPKRVEWYSQHGGYIDLALGDVNLDGDLEIIAIGGDTNPNKNMGKARLVVFDPVVTDPSIMTNPNITVTGYINGIPWAELYRRELPANPRLIDSGNLLAVSPGDEIIYVTEVPNNHRTQLTILSAASAPFEGRDWTEHVDRLAFNNEWSWLRLGDIDKTDLDEIILVDNDQGLLRLYRDIAGDPIFERRNENNRWRGAVIADFRHRSEQDLFAIRSGQHAVSTFWVFQYRNGNFRDDYDEWLQPAPGFIFAADVEGTEGDEAFMLRSVPAELTLPRLISRDENGVTLIEDVLDTDNGYKAGSGGNVVPDPMDGDDKIQAPRDEIIIIRDNAIRIYKEPHAGNAFDQINISTNSRSIRIGDLDAAGYTSGLELVAAPSFIDETMAQGAAEVPVIISLMESTDNVSIPFTVTIAGDVSWMSVEPISGLTPITLTAKLDAGALSPGIYSSAIVVTTSNEQVANQPYRISTTFTVSPGMELLPGAVNFIYFPCDSPQDPRSQTVTVTGGTGDNFSTLANPVDGSPDPAEWVTISPANGALPGEFTIVVDPTPLANQSLLEATIVVQSDGNPISRRSAPLNVLCAKEQISLPLIFK